MQEASNSDSSKNPLTPKQSKYLRINSSGGVFLNILVIYNRMDKIQVEKAMALLNNSLQDLHNAGLSKDALQVPDHTPLNQAYQKITSAIVLLSIEKM